MEDSHAFLYSARREASSMHLEIFSNKYRLCLRGVVSLFVMDSFSSIAHPYKCGVLSILLPLSISISPLPPSPPLSLYLSIYLSIYLHVSLYLSISLSVSLSLSLSFPYFGCSGQTSMFSMTFTSTLLLSSFYFTPNIGSSVYAIWVALLFFCLGGNFSLFPFATAT